MKNLVFNDYTAFACEVSDRYYDLFKHDDLKSVDIIAKYEDARNIIKELVCIGYDIAFITDLADAEYDRYADEFIISLLENEIWCEPAKRESEYIGVEADVVYVLDDCSSKIIPFINSTETYEVEINDCEYYGTRYCDGYCDANKMELSSDSKKYEVSNDKNVKESYKINGKTVSKDEYEKKLKEMDDKFKEHMKTVLCDYHNFISDFTKWEDMFGW